MNKKCFWAFIRREADCWIWSGCIDSHGYGCYGKRKIGAHRLMWQLMRGPIPENLCVCHICDNPRCVNPDHLWLGTRSENTKDRHYKGRSKGPIGEAQHDAKLNYGIAEEIRAITSTHNATQREIAARFGVGQTTISNVVTGKRWKIEAKPCE